MAKKGIKGYLSQTRRMVLGQWTAQFQQQFIKSIEDKQIRSDKIAAAAQWCWAATPQNQSAKGVCKL